MIFNKLTMQENTENFDQKFRDKLHRQFLRNRKICLIQFSKKNFF